MLKTGRKRQQRAGLTKTLEKVRTTTGLLAHRYDENENRAPPQHTGASSVQMGCCGVCCSAAAAALADSLKWRAHLAQTFSRGFAS